jgi:hypothetical protein
MKSAKYAALALLIFFGAQAARADEASKLAKIDEMFAASHVEAMVGQMMSQVQTMMHNQLSQLNVPDKDRPAVEEMQKQVLDLLAGKLSWEKLKPIYVKIYDETFSEEELASIVDFYKTPAGHALIEKMPLLTQKSVTLMQDMMKDLIPEITQMAQDLEKKYPRQ